MTTADEATRVWRARLDALETQRMRDSANLELCAAVWNALDGGVGNNLKSVARAVRTFRAAALQSQGGVERLAAALKEVFEISGQVPTRADLDDELYWAITRTRRHDSIEAIRWLLATLRVESR